MGGGEGEWSKVKCGGSKVRCGVREGARNILQVTVSMENMLDLIG